LSTHLETGRKGEEEAVKFLVKKGYQILHRNWTYDKDEIDIVAKLNELYVFVEVKSRTGTMHGFPEEAVDRSKKIRLLRAIDAYLEEYQIDNEIRIDIVSVIFDGQKTIVSHFEDAVEWMDDSEWT